MRAASSGEAYAVAALIERHAQRVLNVAYRLIDSREDAEQVTRRAFAAALERPPTAAGGEGSFGAHVLAIACAESLDVLARDGDGDGADGGARPAPGAVASNGAGEPLGLEDWQEQTRAANASLPARRRQALALQGPGKLSHAEIARLMDADRDAVALLIARARLELHDALRGDDLASSRAASKDCRTAVRLMAMRDDAQLAEGSERAGWLVDHLAGCRECRLRLDAMQRARIAYAEWELLPPPAALLVEATAIAAERAGRHAADEQPTVALPAAAIPAVSPAPPGRTADARPRREASLSGAERARRRKRELQLAGGWAAALMAVVLALLAGGVFESAEGDDEAVDSAPAVERAAPTPPKLERPRQVKRKPKPRARRKAETVSAQAPQAVVTTPVAPPRKKAKRRRRAESPKKEAAQPPPATTTPAPVTPPTQTTPQTSPAPGGTTGPTPQEPPTFCVNPAGKPAPC